MKTSVIIQLIALPAIMAKLTIQIVTKSTNVNANKGRGRGGDNDGRFHIW